MSFHLFCVYHWSLTDRSRIMESTPDFNNLQLLSKSLVTYVQQALISIKKIAKIAKRQRKFKSLHFFIPKGHTVPIRTLVRPRALALGFLSCRKAPLIFNPLISYCTCLVIWYPAHLIFYTVTASALRALPHKILTSNDFMNIRSLAKPN